MRKAAIAFGVTPETHARIEKSYAEFLSLLEAQLVGQPFLFGGYPTIGDYGLFSPLYAHLARDPKPLHLMQTTAPRVFRWTERMNMPETFIDETTLNAGPDLYTFDAIPDTLKALMQFVAEDYGPELNAHIAFTNDWLEKQDAPTLKPDALGRGIGMAEFDWRGHMIHTAVMPYRLYLLQRLQDAFDSLNVSDRTVLRTLFEELGLTAFLDHRANRRVVRKNHLEEWE